MLSRVKNSTKTSRPGTIPTLSNKGQAMVEYVLLLIISVSIVLALISQIFKPFGEFIDSYMGSYVGCLLEYGELPALGSDEPALVDEDSECDKKFAPGSITKGRPPRGGSGGGDGDGDGNVNDQNGNNRTGNRGGEGEDSNSNASAGGGTYAGSSSRGGSSLINARRRGGNGVEQSTSGAGGKTVEIALDGSAGDGYFNSNKNSRRIGVVKRTRAIGITGLTESERAKLVKKAGGSTAPLIVAGGVAPESKKMAIKKAPVEMKIEEDKPVTIGGFLRYLFIAALVIALVIFIGGQALQYSKSSDK